MTMLDNGRLDRMIVGPHNRRVRENRDGSDRLCTGFEVGAGNGSSALRALRRRLRPDFEDRASGAKTDRPGLTEALAYVPEGDLLITCTWKLDRLAGSRPHLIETVSRLEKSGAGQQSLTEAIGNTTPGGRLIFHVFGALDQFERDLIRERTRAGLAAAASRGRRGGRKPVVTADKLLRAKALFAKGLTVREVASRLKIGKTALYEALNPKTEVSRRAKGSVHVLSKLAYKK
jgi:DNA invertase Pin-like site-specific DNA recombinase